MRIDPKYFNRFIIIAALIGAALIALFTWWNKESREQIFRQRLNQKADSLTTMYFQKISSNDSIRIEQFQHQWVVLDFWSTWAPPSRQSHRVLNRLKQKYRDHLIVISAASQDPINEIQRYIKKHRYPFIFVEGRELYRDLHPPGVPTQIIYGPDGKLKRVLIGFQDSTQYQPLIDNLQHLP